MTAASTGTAAFGLRMKRKMAVTTYKMGIRLTLRSWSVAKE